MVPESVDGIKWEDSKTEVMYNDIRYWEIDPDAHWHGFEGYGKKQYFIVPCKFQLTTAGLNPKTGKYEDFWISANILINYLSYNGIIADKYDLNKFEKLVDDDSQIEIVQYSFNLKVHFLSPKRGNI